MRIVVVVQARTGSTRLPNKVLLPAAGAPVLQRMLERVCAATLPTHVVVATTQLPADDAIVDIARRAKCGVVRGHPTDLVDRIMLAARATSADIVVKLLADCPLLDPDTIDRVVGAFVTLSEFTPIDYASNLHPATWPAGFDVEVMTRRIVETAWREAQLPAEREHVTPFIRARPARFITRNVCWDRGFDYARRYRLTLDYPEDYAVIRGVYEDLWSPKRHFTLPEILAVLESRPALHARNAMHVRPTYWLGEPLV